MENRQTVRVCSTLAIPDVSVDGSTTYDNVTLQLNLANGTFTIQDATVNNTLFSETPIQAIICPNCFDDIQRHKDYILITWS